jgi:4-amino-4-deoxy-L-arabinose transferase-like glycosyltransferase
MPDAHWNWWLDPDVISGLIALLLVVLIWRAVANDE